MADGAGFIPALLTELAASLVYCFSTSLPALAAGSAAPCLTQDYLVSREPTAAIRDR
jgi:hypothetical protein